MPMLSNDRLQIAKTAAEILGGGFIEELERYAGANAASDPVGALLEWLSGFVESSDSYEVANRIRQNGQGRGRIYGGSLMGASNLDDRLLTLLAAPQEKGLIRGWDFLTQNGWEPKLKALAEMARLAAECSDSAALVWLAEKGSLSLQGSPHSQFHNYHTGVCHAFKAQSNEDLAALERLVELGALADGDGLVGFTDFLAYDQPACARKLAELGFQPRSLVIPMGSSQPGASPLAVYARLVVDRHGESERATAKLIARAEEDLSDLAARGIGFALPGPPDQAWNWDPFVISVRYRRSGSERQPIMLAFYESLLKHGADINLSGQYLADEVRLLDWHGGDPVYFENALRLGADPTISPGPLLAAPAHWSGSMRLGALAWMDKLIALGADASKVPISSLANDHPIAAAIEAKNLLYARGALHRGVSPEWTSSADGASCLHLLASYQKPDAVALCAQIARDPRSKHLLDHKTRVAEGKGAETALMRACAELNAAQVKTLLDAGAEVNLQDAKGWSALHHAGRKYGAKAQTKCAPVISLLLAAGADPALVNASGLTAGQAMAKRAPLNGLAELLSLRPEDLTGASEAARLATEALGKRGALATSIVEQAILGAESAPMVKKTRSRL